MERVCAPGLLTAGRWPVSATGTLVVACDHRRRRGQTPVLYLPNHVSLADKARPVAAPVAPSPARTLIEELDAILQSRLNLTLGLILDPGLPLVADEPASDKVVVVGIENVLTPALGFEALEEGLARQDLGTIGASAARHAGGAAVHVVSSRDLKVSALNVGGTKPVVDPGLPVTLGLAADALACADTTNLGVFEGCEDPGDQGGGPRDIIVGHDGDGGADTRESLAHLEALVGNGCPEDADTDRRQSFGELLERLKLVSGGHEDHLVRMAGQNAVERGAELLEGIVNCRDDDGDVVSGECRLRRYRLGLVEPVAEGVHDEAEVTVDPM